MDLREIPQSSEIVYHGVIFDVERMQVSLPDGKPARRDLVRHRGACAIVAINAQQELVLVRQYRAAFDDIVVELPAGKIDPGEDPRVCAERELAEETGYTSAHWQKLTVMLSSPGFCDEVLHIYLATDIRGGQRHLDEGEFVDVQLVPFHDAVQQIMQGRLQDAKTIVGILMAQQFLRQEDGR